MADEHDGGNFRGPRLAARNTEPPRQGSISVVDRPQLSDKRDTVAAIIVDIHGGGMVRCPLSKFETINLARALLTEVS